MILQNINSHVCTYDHTSRYVGRDIGTYVVLLLYFLRYISIYLPSSRYLFANVCMYNTESQSSFKQRISGFRNYVPSTV